MNRFIDKCMNTVDKLSQKQQPPDDGNVISSLLKSSHLCPEIPAITKMAHSTKFHKSEWTFMDLTILTNFSQFRQSGNQLGGFDDFDEYSPFSLLHAVLDISHLWTLLKMFVLGKKEPTEDEHKGDKGQSGNWSWTNTLPPTRRKLVVP